MFWDVPVVAGKAPEQPRFFSDRAAPFAMSLTDLSGLVNMSAFSSI
jgi:hypothetical protein